LLFPPLAEIENFGKTFTLISKLPLVNDQADWRVTALDAFENAIERDLSRLAFAEEKPQRQISARHFSWRRDEFVPQPAAHLFVARVFGKTSAIFCDQHRPV